MDAMYPGTFDPITLGHCDMVRRAAGLFGRVVVAVASNPGKKPMFDANERLRLARESLAGVPNVEVVGYDCLTIDFAKDNRLGAILRGLRAVSDFEFEFQLASMNRRLTDDIETVFLTPAEQFTFVSSSMIREIAMYGGDVSEFVPAPVLAALYRKRQSRS